ncbi:MAG: hypothetical protein EOO60_03190, partial [Hymenobacter sp.]
MELFRVAGPVRFLLQPGTKALARPPDTPAAFKTYPNLMTSCRLVCLLLGWLLLPRASPAQAVPYGHNPAAGHYQAVRGVRLYYEEYGAGPPLLLIHGNGGSIQDFKQNIPYFARHYRVLAVDSRAHG